MKYSLKGHQDRKRHKNRINRMGKLGWFMFKTSTVTCPSREGEPAGTDATIKHGFISSYDISVLGKLRVQSEKCH